MSPSITVCEEMPRHKVLMLPRDVPCPACGRPWSEHKTIELEPPRKPP